ncbi:TPA: type III restriction-modification system endonuclease [Staphylococcus aureus]|nr:type III restriction-modification system endonuclease [Staphylococcus aureus]
MVIKLEKNLPHQLSAIKAVNTVFEDVDMLTENPVHQNPLIDLSNPKIKSNISSIWEGQVDGLEPIPHALRRSIDDGILGLDIKMENGTGKTYVYTRMMYELNKLGFNKFILLVPSTPIREGTQKFIEADYSKREFSDLYPGRQIVLSVLTSQKKAKGRKMFPTAISEFARGTRLDQSRIHTLLMTDSMLLSKATMAKDDYDQTLLGTYTQPYQTLRDTRPIVIIDEPHRFKRENKAYEAIVEELQPQMIIRFGATFPNIDKSDEVDYNNLIYNLGASQSFNANLVKGVATQTLENINEDGERLKLMKYTMKPKEVHFRNEKTKKNYVLTVGDDLGEIHSGFSGIKIESLSRSETTSASKGVTITNGLVINETDIIHESTFSSTYQELMMRQAVRNHLRIEHENFMRTNKIKTLSLFFIDSIYSYRGSNDTKGPLRVKFEEILAEETTKLINEYEDLKELNTLQYEYLDFLKDSLKDIDFSSGGYFAEDNSIKDEDIKKEVDQILRDKDSLLAFKGENGKWNTRRFIFSKWTLREGWDNPNVFQIAKLRSSGSDISKLQEVGRGLRLPVDEYGQRISDEQFYLTYLIDFSEIDFAKRLTNEINAEVSQLTHIRDLISKAAEDRKMEEKALFIELLQKDLITMDYEIVYENSETFFTEYPEFNRGLKPGKVIESNKEKKTTVKIISENYKKIKSLWKELNQKYYLKLEKANDERLLSAIEEILSDKQDSIYVRENVHVTEERTKIKDGAMIIKEEIVDTYLQNEKIPYNEFLIRLNKGTGLPVQLIHQGLVNYFKNKEIPTYYFNRTTLSNFIQKFKSWFIEEYDGHYTYERLHIDRDETALTDYEGKLKKEIVQGSLGLYRAEHIVTPDSFLYDTVVYDSPKELATIKETSSNRLKDKVVVFGKIPRKSIQVPLYFGGTVSPDFMYVLEDNEEEYRVGFIVETKDVKNREGLRGEEKNRIRSAQSFFETMKAEGMNVEFKAQLQNDEIIEMIEQLFV